jgi:hypothetical protein
MNGIFLDNCRGLVLLALEKARKPGVSGMLAGGVTDFFLLNGIVTQDSPSLHGYVFRTEVTCELAL